MPLKDSPPLATRTNTILDGAVQMVQPARGYRSAIDPIFLAASLDVKGSESVLEMGAGAGTALLALAHRVLDIKIIGLEFQRDMVRLASHNIKLNGFHDRLEVIHGDLLTPPPRLAASSFSHVMANPPYFETHKSTPSTLTTKALSNHGESASLETWVTFAHRMVKPKGSVTFVFSADRLDDLIAAMYGKFGEITIFPLWPKAGQKAKRFIIRGRKNIKAPSQLLNGLVVHEANGEYTQRADNILRHAKALVLTEKESH